MTPFSAFSLKVESLVIAPLIPAGTCVLVKHHTFSGTSGPARKTALEWQTSMPPLSSQYLSSPGGTCRLAWYVAHGIVIEGGLGTCMHIVAWKTDVNNNKFAAFFKMATRRAHLSGVCRRQVYGFSLNVTKGTADSDVAYGLPRSDVASVNIEVSPKKRSSSGGCSHNTCVRAMHSKALDSWWLLCPWLPRYHLNHEKVEAL